MKDPWQSYLQLGIVHPMAFPECLAGDGPQLATLREICYDPFFDGVDVGVINDAGQRRECAALLRDCRMSVTLSLQPMMLRLGLDLNSANPVERNRAVQAILDCLEQGRELGASAVSVMSGKNVASGRSAAVGWLIESLQRICRAARERVGLPVVLEIFDYDVDKKALVGTCATARQVALAVRKDYPDFGLLHDLSHIYLCHEEPASHFPIIREFLVHMHAGNSVSDPKHALYGDQHPLFGISGGDSDVPELRDYIKTLFDVGYLRPGRRPILGFEIRTPPGMPPQTAIANMKRTWQRAWWSL